MSEKEQDTFMELIEKMDKRHRVAMSTIYTLVGIICVGVIGYFVAFGEVKAQGLSNTKDIGEIKTALTKMDQLNKSLGTIEGLLQEHLRNDKR